MNENIIQIEQTQDLPLNINGEKVLLNRDVACLHEVETKRVNETVKIIKKDFLTATL